MPGSSLCQRLVVRRLQHKLYASTVFFGIEAFSFCPKRFSSNNQLADLFTTCRVSLIEEEFCEGGHREQRRDRAGWRMLLGNRSLSQAPAWHHPDRSRIREFEYASAFLRRGLFGRTGAAEAVRVIYDKEVIPLPLLLEAYLRTVDPTSLNRQGNDRGTQYRTGIYWTDERDAPIVISELSKVERRIGRRVRVEARPLQSFYPAEPYHQNYLDVNPSGYCHVNLADAADFVSEHAADFAIAQHDSPII